MTVTNTAQNMIAAYPQSNQVRLLFVVNQLRFFVSHRLPLAVAARNMGFDVHIAYGEGSENDAARFARQFRMHYTPLARGGSNPFRDTYAIWNLYCLLRRVRPTVVHLITLKPVLYGGIAARLAKVPGVAAAIAGMGFTFTDERGFRARVLRTVMRPLFRLALAHQNVRIILQNADDQFSVLHLGRIDVENVRIIKGSGVDVEKIEIQPEPGGNQCVIMAARLLYDKGAAEFVEAARILRGRGYAARFVLLGDSDALNPRAIPRSVCEAWAAEGHVEFLGHRNDVIEKYSQSNIVVLPSYREGFPKALMEAAACGRPVVTTDVPGCRDAIIPDVTGLVVPARSPVSLANAIAKLLDDKDLRYRMGRAGRQLAEKEFGIDRVVRAHIDIYRELL